MGVSSVAGPPVYGQSTFSRDVLKIELSGPKRENLTIIDIPGIFRTPTPGVTTKDDMALVNEMVRDYIRDERTIILAVLPANADLATQSILTMAEEVDPEGLRTLGVLTKPDLVDEGAEKNIIDLVEGKTGVKLRLGYCIVRNRGQKDLSTNSTEREATERAFFNSGPWASVDKDRVGVAALAERLQDILQSITRKSMPFVKKEIENKLKKAKHRLADLGDHRETREQQIVYLQQMATKFQRLTDYALDVYYERDPVFKDHLQLRLPTLVADRSDEFSTDIEDRGHTVDFEDDNEEGDVSGDNSGSGGQENEDSSNAPSDSDTNATKRDEHLSKYPELEEFALTNDPIETLAGGAMKWIETEYRNSRGVGLADIGPAVIPSLWHHQSKNWERLTSDYVADVIYLVHDFIHSLLLHVCSDERTRTGLAQILNDLIIVKYTAALEHAKFVLEVERCGTQLTHNHYYNDTLQSLRQAKYKKNMEAHAVEMYSEWKTGKSQKCIPISTLSQVTSMGNLEHSVADIHMVLQSYYKVARKRFVDVLCMQVTDHHLMKGQASPLRLFDPMWITTLSDEQLEDVAGEDQASKRLRVQLGREIAALTAGLKELRGLARR